jgi:oxalate decarboxylase/phosphoglucose isomerase-like protein (cupin superfamily)
LRDLSYLFARVYEEINLSTWLAANPAYIVEDNFGLTKAVVDKLPSLTIPAGPA